MTKLLWLWLTFMLMSGCSQKNRYESVIFGESESFTHYAIGFDVSDHGDFRLIEVHNPWQNSRGVTFAYVLASQRAMVPDSLADLRFIKPLLTG